MQALQELEGDSKSILTPKSTFAIEFFVARCFMQEALLLELHPKALATAVRRVQALQELHVTPEELLRVVALVSMWAHGLGISSFV
jgi:hypothetical protein